MSERPLSSDKVTLEKDPHGPKTQYLFRPAGWPARYAVVNVSSHRCGHIEDGISLDLSDCQRPNGSQWHPGGVIAFRDLEAIYFAAKAAREKQ